MTALWIVLAAWLVLACALAVWLGPRLRRAEERDRQRRTAGERESEDRSSDGQDDVGSAA